MTLVARDEADVIEAHLAYHLAAGVDVVLVTDHRSVDGTTEILERYARDTGRVRVFREDGEHTQQGAWVTSMARLAAVDHEADWVLHSDADEFWWAGGESLGQVLAAVPARYGVIDAVQRSLLPVADDGRPFWERMIVRLSPSAPINDTGTPFRPVGKVAHRGHPSVVVHHGNHTVDAPLAKLATRRLLEVLHAPLRSRAQCARKYAKTWSGWDENLRGDLARVRGLSHDGRAEAYYERVALDAAMIEHGLADGSLTIDTRLRDALRAIAARDAAAGTAPLHLPTPSPSERRRLAFDAVLLDETTLVRLQRTVDGLDAAIATRLRRGRTPPLGGGSPS